MPGDIDVLIVLPDPATSRARAMMTLLATLVRDGFLLDEMDWRKKLMDGEHVSSHTFHGICRGEHGVARRIDIKVYPPSARVREKVLDTDYIKRNTTNNRRLPSITVRGRRPSAGGCAGTPRWPCGTWQAATTSMPLASASATRCVLLIVCRSVYIQPLRQGVWPIAVHSNKWRRKPPPGYTEKKETKAVTIYRFDRIEVQCETDIFRLLQLEFVPWWMRGATVEK